jgi:hypothetical protein
MLQIFRDGLRQTYMVALRIIYAAVAKQADGMCVRNKLCNGLFAHTLRNADNGFDDQMIYRIDAEVTDKLTVNFQVIEGKILEVIKGRKTCTEVVQCEPAATSMYPIGKGTCLLQIGDCRRFG